MSISACAEIVRRGDPDRFLATMAAPVRAREKLFPIYAFNVEVARAPWVTAEPMIAEMRLQWWRDALDEMRTRSLVRAHEVTDPLNAVIDAQSAAILDELIEARRWDIYKETFEDDAHFERYLDRTAGGLLWVAARALGLESGEAAIRDIGWAAGLAAWFQAVPELEASGRFPLVDGRGEAIARLAQEGLRRLNGADLPKGARAAVLSTWQARPLLQRVIADPGCVAAGRLGLSEFKRRSSLLLKSFGL